MERSKKKSLTSLQLTRAIYIDFEGFKDKTPSLLGVLIEDQFKHYVLDERLGEAAKHKKLECVELQELAQRLLRISKSQGRQFVAWSNHEKNIIKQFAAVDMEDYYFNPIKTARRWYFRTRGENVPEGATLTSFMDYTNFERKSHLVKGKATKWIGVVLDQLEKKKDFTMLTPTAKRFWTNLLNYNKQDCEALRHIALVTSQVDEP